MRLLLTLIPIALTFAAPALAGPEPTGFYVLQYLPGPNWEEGYDYQTQPRLDQHRKYLSALHDNELVVMGGPFEGKVGAMVIVRVNTLAQAQGIASRDPAVIDRVLAVEITPWRVNMSSMRQFRRNPQGSRDPDAPFRVERRDPNAPINLEDDGK